MHYIRLKHLTSHYRVLSEELTVGTRALLVAHAVDSDVPQVDEAVVVGGDECRVVLVDRHRRHQHAQLLRLRGSGHRDIRARSQTSVSDVGLRR